MEEIPETTNWQKLTNAYSKYSHRVPQGVGPQRGELLKKELGIYTYGQLLEHYPFRYIDRTRFYKIKQLHAELPHVQVLARVLSKTIVGEKRSKRLVVELKDDTGTMELVWFQSIKWFEKMIQVGSVYILFGKPSAFNGRISMSHPEIEAYNPQAKKQGNLRLQPVYPSTEKLKLANLDSKGIQRLQVAALETCLKEIDETLPEYVLKKHQLIPKKRPF